MAKNWAICVGINKYQFIQHLTCAVNDAEEMHCWLKETAKFEQTYLFTDNSPPIEDMTEPLPSQPTFTTLRRWLRKRFPPNSKPPLSASDSLWFFFSGHGVREQGQDYLLLSDSDPDPEEINNSAISLAFVTEYLRQSGAGNIMLFVDACRSVAKSGLGIELQAEQGIISIASCRPREKSYEIEALNHGSFTYALLESLQIQGEQNCATVERLAKRLKDRVAEINRQHQKPKQTPYTRIEPETKNYLIFLPQYIQPTRQDIATLRENALKAEIEDDLKLAEVLWTRLVIHDPDEALKSLRRIWLKLQQPSFNSTVSLPSESVQTLSPKSPESSPSSPSSPSPKSSPSPQILTETLPGGIILELVKIPAGSFLMGSPDTHNMAYDDEKPQHQVNLQEFYLGKYPVTQEQYEAVMGNNPSRFKDNPKNPVERVSWDDAQEFCKKLSQLTGKKYRLPTEAEWEYACRAWILPTPFEKDLILPTPLFKGGGSPRDYFGDDAAKLGEYAWYDKNSGSKTHPVGQKKPNDWGLYDMSGNVWEWCEDNWHGSYADKPENIKNDGSIIWSSSDTSRRVLRGGSWNHDPWYCRSASRNYGGSRDADLGFRVVSPQDS
jgi:formylglycine-generating enzyme required for sulfatase activity